MTDIEKLRDAVIEAARKYARGPGNGDYQHAKDWDVLVESLDALDEAEKPDPWALLAEYINDTDGEDDRTWDDFCKSWEPRVKAALAWKEQNDG